MPHIVTRQHTDRLWYWCSVGPNGEELMRSNVGRRLRAGVELDVRVLRVLAANPGAVAVELTQSLRAGDWLSHLCVVHEIDYEATGTVWYLQRADAQAVGDVTLSAFR